MKTLLLAIGLFVGSMLQAQIGVIKVIGLPANASYVVASPSSPPGFVLPVACIVYCATPLPNIFISDTTVLEAAGIAVLKVALSESATQIITVNYGTTNGTAMQGQDYKQTKGSLQFGAGETEKTISVNIVSDKKAENNEYFFIDLSEPENADISRANGKITIEDVPSAAKIKAIKTDVHLFEVKVMPNPSQHQFSITIAGKESNARIEIKIMDDNGRLLKTLSGPASKNFIFGEHLKPGVYLVEIWQKNERRTVTIIKR